MSKGDEEEEKNREKLRSLREDIDLIDKRVLKLLNRRFGKVKGIERIKRVINKEVDDEAREKEIMEKVEYLAEEELENINQDFLEEFYDLIFTRSKEKQRKKRLK